MIIKRLCLLLWAGCMSKINDMKFLILFLVLGIFGIGAGLNYWHHYTSTEYQSKQLALAIQKNQYTNFKKICPQFTNGQVIDKETFQLYRSSLDTKSKLVDLEKMIRDVEQFEMKNENNFWRPTQFYTIPRTIEIEMANGTKLISKISNKTIPLKNKKLGPFISSEYSVKYLLDSPIYGEIESNKKEDLRKSNQKVSLDESSVFIQNDSFQRKLLKRIVEYYVSMNQCIKNDLSFGALDAVTIDEKKKIQAEFDELRPYMNSYDQKFQTFVVNSESFKVESGNETKVTFDLYTDNELTVQLKKESGITEPLIDKSHNAEVTMLYDQDQKDWVIQTLDFETYVQDPSKWTKQQKIKLEQVNEGTWDSENPTEMI